ncbi:MAG: hypothetical protein ACYS17_05065, partial [Planctomycetota bacterium]
TEAADSWEYKSKTYKSTYAGLYRWRREFQNDFAARMDWCLKSFDQTNHPPAVKLDHKSALKIKTGQTVILCAKGTKDPDGDKLTYKWWQYKEPGSYPGLVKIKNADKQHASFIAPKNAKQDQNVHIICEVTDNGSPPLTRYQRVIVEFASK